MGKAGKCPWFGCNNAVKLEYERDGIKAGMCWKHWKAVIKELRR